MNKKKKIIISVITSVLLLATAFAVIASVIGRENDIKKAREEYEQAQNAKTDEITSSSDITASDTDVPSIVPDDSGSHMGNNDIILDVTDKDRDPNPGVKNATIEYGTKEGDPNEE